MSEVTTKPSTVRGRIFSRAFREIHHEIPFKAEYHNGTGYFNVLTQYPLNPGQQAKTRDENGRRIILTGTRFGTVVIFDRYAGQNENGIYTHNTNSNSVLRTLLCNGSISDETMENLFSESNIGLLIETMAKDFQEV